MLFYNNYDVQPPDPLDLWDSEPFDPQVREGKLYARGVADDKGDLLARLQAIEAYQATLGELPLQIKCVFEGEEEEKMRADFGIPRFIRGLTGVEALQKHLHRPKHRWIRPLSKRPSLRPRRSTARSR